MGSIKFVLEGDESMFGCGLTDLVGVESQLREDKEDGGGESEGWRGEGGCET